MKLFLESFELIAIFVPPKNDFSFCNKKNTLKKNTPVKYYLCLKNKSVRCLGGSAS